MSTSNGTERQRNRIKVSLIRHGQTAGNRERRYIGVTDEPLCEEGIHLLEMIHAAGNIDMAGDICSAANHAGAEEICREYAVQVFCSPLVRCVQSARILFPDAVPIIIPELAEMDFGIFENRSYEGDLEYSKEYRKWLDSRCEDRIPGGESKAAFIQRCAAGFEKAMQRAEDLGARKAALVVHGGTVMSILSRYADLPGEYYEWNPSNGHGYEGMWDGKVISNLQKI